MSEALPTLDNHDRPFPNFQPPPNRPRNRIDAPPGPTPTQISSEPPRNHNPHWIRYDPPPHLQNQNRGSNSNAIIVRSDPTLPYQYPTQRPSSRIKEVPSTIFYVGPIPPNFTIDQIHQAMRTLNPKVAMLDLKMGVMEVEIPYTLTWHQIGDCELFLPSLDRELGELMNRVQEGFEDWFVVITFLGAAIETDK